MLILDEKTIGGKSVCCSGPKIIS